MHNNDALKQLYKRTFFKQIFTRTFEVDSKPKNISNRNYQVLGATIYIQSASFMPSTGTLITRYCYCLWP